jgi:ribonuclease P protein component
MRPHSDYVLVGRRAALTCDFATMLEDLRSALHRLDRQPKKDPKAFSGESLPRARSGVDTGSRKEDASKHKDSGASRTPN